MQADGSIAAVSGDHAVNLGQFSPAAIDRAADLATGLPLASMSGRSALAKQVLALAQRLARHRLLDYRLFSPREQRDLVIIEPQIADYWPRPVKLSNGDTVVLSRFAYLRRRGNEMVLESPRAGALFRIGDPAIAAMLAALSRPQQIGKLRRQMPALPLDLLGLLLDSALLLKLGAKDADGLRVNEGDGDLVLWDFHDFVFHTRSTEGRHGDPVGGAYAYAGVTPPLPAVRPRWPGKAIPLGSLAPAPTSPFAALLHARHSTRDFDDRHPITLTELARFLGTSARVMSEWTSGADAGGGHAASYSSRPYPAAGSAYELELYLTVSNCEGLARGFYHYDAGGHALVAIDASAQQIQALAMAATFAMDASGPPQILITIAARFGRISRKYSSIAYSLILKDVGSLIQTFYLTATDMGLGGCAIGTSNIDLFAAMTGLDFHVEGPVGQFALGRARKAEA
ncbi:SagB family peptide dehydrogenase [Bradyrhizobium sp.]|uniref:SagB/ThcOx family dehydrogenase n=1 Tax=Bradyrhizobium sp. TaxID=376 RepID=UPI0039E5FAEE